MLSQTSKIAIKAVIYLSDKSLRDEKAGVEEIATRINASKHTVSKAMQTLVKENIINSQKGPTGGFYLDEEQQQKAIYYVIEAIEGEDIFTQCGLGLTKCSDCRPCPIHNEYKEVRSLIHKIFKEKKIIDLREPVKSGIAFLMD